MMPSPDHRFITQAQALGFPVDAPMKIGGNYTPALRDGNHIHVSGQIPRVGDTIVVIGAAGADVSLEQARHGARISTLRALTLVRQLLGGSL
ncbi:MAG: hypothetical protein RL722_1505, partial [Pseudomonadota bacterium]